MKINCVDFLDISHHFSEDEIMVQHTTRQFVENEVLPKIQEHFENGSFDFDLIPKFGELGFLGMNISHKYGCAGMSNVAYGLMCQEMERGDSGVRSFVSVQGSLVMYPIYTYGSEHQREKWLPKLASGEFIGCFGLTEPNYGSNPSGMLTRAVKVDGGYKLDGSKMWITNGTIADIAIVWAKCEDSKVRGFIVEKGMEGYVVGAEEKKMGIKGSSTVTLYFENCKVPIENVLGKVGQGGAIAFNVLYVGRYKLGITATSGSKTAMLQAYNFGKERMQFSRPITEFGMIKNKFAKMVVKVWESDTICYATTGSIDESISKIDKSDSDYYAKMQKSIEDHGIEASICKIVGSETLAYAVDECVQVFGGAGFIEEYPAAEAYRDERINRIFEGTNEINRLLIAGLMLKKAIMEELPIRDQIFLREKKWTPDVDFDVDHELCKEIKIIELSRSLVLNILHQLIVKYGQDLKNEQWVLEPLADLITSFSIMQTGFTRYNQLDLGKHKELTLPVVTYSIYDNFSKLLNNSKKLIRYTFSDFTEKNKMIDEIISSIDYQPNSIKLKEVIAEEFYRNGKYYLD